MERRIERIFGQPPQLRDGCRTPERWAGERGLTELQVSQSQIEQRNDEIRVLFARDLPIESRGRTQVRKGLVNFARLMEQYRQMAHHARFARRVPGFRVCQQFERSLE